ncbi:hypothetical protein HanIR_Chr04g0181631 [Helianthus annuus]|nr:hypothetical protein HanIR_Chr04g0181631 [Helianthus annuus]
MHVLLILTIDASNHRSQTNYFYKPTFSSLKNFHAFLSHPGFAEAWLIWCDFLIP